jgi:hypothetical protein
LINVVIAKKKKKKKEFERAVKLKNLINCNKEKKKIEVECPSRAMLIYILISTLKKWVEYIYGTHTTF